MKNVKRWTFITAAFLILVIVSVDAAAPFKKVSIATTPKTTSTTSSSGDAAAASSAEEESTAKAKEEKSEHAASHTSSTKDSKLTGIPQIDYIWDPNLPRELRGYNLSSYPFLSTTPTDDEIHFKCDGLHDGFYASIEYKCQLYHHCVYGIRHDFLCANFTAFDQRTFICHFVSDVDCEGSMKYWNRNDDLYMATTTTSTTTTTTEPPPTQRRRPVRPLRPLRRPSNRRPLDDYYDEEDEYDEDYYEERINRRRKQRPRHRKPVVDYDDEYEDEKRSFADDKPRRPNGRDRIRDDVEPEDDYDTERRPLSKPRSKTGLASAADRRKLGGRKPGSLASRAGADERRSFSDDRPLTGRRKATAAVDEEPEEPVDTPRRASGRRRINEKRSTTSSPSSDLDDLDEYEKPKSQIPDQDEAAADEEAPPKIKTTPKPLEEFVTPKANPSSVYARPRAPPRIARPVPVNAKNKFQYPVQRTATTSAPPARGAEDEDYYEDEEYDDARGHRGHNKKRVVDDATEEEEEAPAPKRGISPRKPTRTLRKPVTEKKALPADEEEDYDERYTRRGTSRRRNPLTGRNRSRGPSHDDVDFVDDDYEERPAKRSRPGARKGAKKPRLPEPSEEVETEDVEPLAKGRGGAQTSSRRKPLTSIPSRSRSPAAQALVNSDEADSDAAEELDDTPAASGSKNNLPTSRPASVRVVKRPFLPSRGGSPYLPRGLQPVGVAHKTHEPQPTTDSSGSMIDMFSTNSGVHLLEHGAPLLRDSGPRTTLPPRSAIPVSQPRPETQPSSKATLDELYENDYDVTLNDALNPTLKPLSPHQSNHYHQHHDNNNRPYQSIYSPYTSSMSSSSSSSSSPNTSPLLSSSDSFVYKNQSPQTSSSTSSSSAHSPSFQSQSQTQLTQSQNYQQPPQQLPQHHEYQSNSHHNINSNNNNNYNSDSYFSPTDIRRRTIISPPAPQSSRTSDYQHRTNSNIGSRIAPAPNYYDDDYEY